MNKGILLPFKLMGVDGMQVINDFYNSEETSAIRWKFIENIIEKPTTKDYLYWNDFKRWLKIIEIITVFDFCDYIEWLWKIS